MQPRVEGPILYLITILVHFFRFKGISFTSEECALVYLVDGAGTRTTTDQFTDMCKDFSLSVFYSTSKHGSEYVDEAIQHFESATYWIDDGTEHWIINGVRITQAADGLLRIAKSSNKYLVSKNIFLGQTEQ